MLKLPKAVWLPGYFDECSKEFEELSKLLSKLSHLHNEICKLSCPNNELFEVLNLNNESLKLSHPNILNAENIFKDDIKSNIYEFALSQNECPVTFFLLSLQEKKRNI